MDEQDHRERARLEAIVDRGFAAQRQIVQESAAGARDLELLRADVGKILRTLFEGNGDSLLTRVRRLEDGLRGATKGSDVQAQRRWDVLVLVAGALLALVLERFILPR